MCMESLLMELYFCYGKPEDRKESEKGESQSLKEEADFKEKDSEKADFEEPEFRENVQSHLTEVRKTLMQTNQALRELEDLFTEHMTEKVSTQFLELYNLIADVKDRTLSECEKRADPELENTACNMEVFQQMIEEYLLDYGIVTTRSEPDDPFRAKYQATVNMPEKFDPRKAKVKRSLRNGFFREGDEQVLQKEQVETYMDGGEAYVSWN